MGAGARYFIGFLWLPALLASASPLAAQFRVTPDGSPLTVPLNSTEKTVRFTLYTGVSQQQTWHITPTCSGVLTNCWSPSGYDLTFIQATGVDIKFQTPAAGSGTVTLTAERLGVSDNGSYNVTVDGTPPEVRLLAPTGQVDVQFPTIQIAWCDNNSLNPGSRWVKVNGVDKTSSFDYVGSGPADCVVKATSTSSSVSLDVGSNTIAANICDNAGNCTSNSFTVTRVTYGVAVTPDGSSTPQRPANSTGYSTDFSVQNTGSAQNTYSLSCGGSTNVTCTGLTVDGQSASSVTLTAGALKAVTASYNVGAVGNGTLSLTATGTNASDGGSYAVPVVTPSAQPSIVDVNSVNPGNFVERGLCLTVAAGAAAASECGDLRIAHSLPTVRTMNRARAPTLLYNSQTAHPYPVVAANVTLPSGAAVPDSVTATLWIGPPQATAKWLGSQWAPGQTRRVALGFDALSYATGVYAYTLEIRNWYPDPTPSQPTTVTGELIVVNRSSSPFGAGWWLAGLEELFWIPDGRRLVVLGDGSARVYSPVGGYLYTTTNPTRPDTLDGRDSDYVRIAPHGVRVHLSAVTGKHIFTVNRLGHRTDFAYDQTCRRLSTITMPPSGSGTAYTFNYASPTDCATRLVSVTDPRNRTTTLTNPTGKVTAISDPDTYGVALGYDPSFANRIISRTDRRGNTTFYAYDASGKLTTDSLPLETGQTPIVQRFRSAETVELAGPVDTAAVYTRVDGPRVDADVHDTTAFWLDRFGAPRRIVNALGYETVLKREDSRWPALVTELRAPNQFVTRATYTARGNDSTTTAVNPFGDGRDAVTRYHWDPKWDYVDSIITPMNVVTTMGYDVNNGNRLWQQVGGDAARRVSFRYGNNFGLLSATVLPQTPADSIEYDTALGNLTVTRTPRGFWTSYYKDALGRDTLVVTPIDSTDKARGGAADSTARVRHRTVFTVMDQDSIVETIAPNRTEAVRIDKRHDAAGNQLSLARVSVPDPTSPAIGTITTQWRYDRANRRVAEVAPDGMVDSTEYDPSSNVIKAITRRKDPTSQNRLAITMTYDALNRLLTRALPQITYQSRPTQFLIQPPGSVWDAQPYPAYQIAAETHTFTYDAMGQLLTAENADAKVKRTYYPGGLIRLDSLRIQTVARDDWERHKYGLEYTYDLDGGRTVLAVPHQLGIGNDTTISYAYDLQVGRLQTVTALQSRDYTFGYNVRGDLNSIYYPWYTAYSEGLGYDPDGQLAADTIWNNASASYPRIQSAPLVRATSFFYDARHKLQLSGETIQLRDTLRPTYSGLGNLKGTTWSEWGCTWCQIAPTDRHVTTETLTPDALGNLVQSNVTDQINGISYDPWGDQWHYQSSTSCCDTWSYQPGTGRMTTMSVAQQYPRSFFYDSAGNQDFSSAMDPNNGKTATERAAFYAADGSLRMVDARAANVPHVYMGEWQTYVVEDYRYDALGRRVWLRARKWCDDYGKDVPAATECRVGLLRRIVWDGDQEIAEIQMPWALQGVTIGGHDTTLQQQWWENDVNPVSLPLLNVTGSMLGDPNPFFGHVIYGGRSGTDQPLAITRVNYVMGMDWRYGNNGSQFIYNPPRVQSPFTIVPFWNANGDAPVGVFGTGVQALCNPPDQYTACVAIRWPWNWSSSDHNGGLPHDYWHGSLLDGKRDGSGFRYMRNRYYDPLTGRFTQEDPLGLAGGLNAYGFAAGDPINFSDPFGLHPCSAAGNQDHDDSEGTGTYDATGKEITKTVHVDCSRERALAAFREGQRRRAWIHLEETLKQGFRCAAAAFAVGANVVETVGLVEVGAGLEIGWAGAATEATANGIFGATVDMTATYAQAGRLITEGAAHMAGGAALKVKALEVSGEAASGELGWESLLPVAGLPNAVNAVAENCPNVF